MRVFIEPYKMASQSAKNLARALGAKRIRPEGSRFKFKATRLVINWGKSTPSNWQRLVNYHTNGRCLNPWERITYASDKNKTFQRIVEFNSIAPTENVVIPDFTTNIEVAKSWVKEGRLICSRAFLRSHSGRGMEVSPQPLTHVLGVPVKLWVRYVRKSREYRVHVFNSICIDVQQKRSRHGQPRNYLIRSYENGWAFCRQNIANNLELETIKTQSLRAVRALGLDFGAVDVVWSEKNKKATVLEINTSPGLSGTTIQKYAEAIRSYIDKISIR